MKYLRGPRLYYSKWISKDIKELKETHDKTNTSNKEKIDELTKQVELLQNESANLRQNNQDLTEKLLDLEYLIFEGITDPQWENDEECRQKIETILKCIPDLNSENIQMARCHRLGPYKGFNRSIIVNFHWFGDVQTIL